MNNSAFTYFKDRHTRTAYADTLSEDTDELLRLLLLIDFSEGFFFLGLTDSVIPTVKEVIKQKNVDVYIDDWNLVYHLLKEKAIEFDIKLVNSKTTE